VVLKINQHICIPLDTSPKTAAVATEALWTASSEDDFLSNFARQAGFVLLRNGATWRVFRKPEEILVAHDLDSLKKVLGRVQECVQQGGEAAGVLNYESGYAFEPRLFSLPRPTDGPLCWFGLYAGSEVRNDISFPSTENDRPLEDSEISISDDDYQAGIGAIRRLIEAGEVYQINFTTRISFTAKQSAWETFKTLFRQNPVPYAAFLNTGAEQIVSLSPEMFFKIENGRITVKPMKGTAARGRSLKEDLLSADQLQRSEKNRAENVMIVDLMRNDLGRICRIGSVKTTKLFDVERFPTLWQMTSTIEGDLLDGSTVESIFSALFPSGSVTGAPKIRAMEHISNLEDTPRGVYTGTIGFFAPERALFNVAIRTLELHGAHGTMGIGSGITYDSDPSAEREECRLKADFLTNMPPEFEIIETMFWERDYRLLDLHMARMRDSAEYFGFDLDEDRVRMELRHLAEQFSLKPKRVRVALSRDGELAITHADFIRCQFGRVGISSRLVHSQDRFLFHKTTNRKMYERTFVAARKRELDDFLFFNEKGELTEGAIHNVFLVTDQGWKTPSVTCGLLPGTYRAHVLKMRSDCSEAVLHLDDLKNADAIYLCNGVRGIFPVKIDWNVRWQDDCK
jgi:para-aminobenzoate synthetase/4-amino-4-deoxychorismate lyase